MVVAVAVSGLSGRVVVASGVGVGSVVRGSWISFLISDSDSDDLLAAPLLTFLSILDLLTRGTPHFSSHVHGFAG